MPSSAIATGLIDLVVPVEAMGEKLVGYVAASSPHELVGGVTGDTAEERAEARPPRDLRDLARPGRARFQRLQGEDLPAPGAAPDAGACSSWSLAAYIDRLRQDPDEVTLLFRDLLIGVTTFFRDSEAFAALDTDVIPRLLEARERRRLRAGLGARLRHRRGGLLDRHPAARAHWTTLAKAPKVQMFGTDIDEAALASRGPARYP